MTWAGAQWMRFTRKGSAAGQTKANRLVPLLLILLLLLRRQQRDVKAGRTGVSEETGALSFNPEVSV